MQYDNFQKKYCFLPFDLNPAVEGVSVGRIITIAACVILLNLMCNTTPFENKNI